MACWEDRVDGDTDPDETTTPAADTHCPDWVIAAWMAGPELPDADAVAAACDTAEDPAMSYADPEAETAATNCTAAAEPS